MPVDDGIPLLLYARDKEEEDRLFLRWVNGPQFEYGYEEFKKALAPARVDTTKTLEDIDELMETTHWQKVEVRTD